MLQSNTIESMVPLELDSGNTNFTQCSNTCSNTCLLGCSLDLLWISCYLVAWYSSSSNVSNVECGIVKRTSAVRYLSAGCDCRNESLLAFAVKGHLGCITALVHNPGEREQDVPSERESGDEHKATMQPERKQRQGIEITASKGRLRTSIR